MKEMDKEYTGYDDPIMDKSPRDAGGHTTTRDWISNQLHKNRVYCDQVQ